MLLRIGEIEGAEPVENELAASRDSSEARERAPRRVTVAMHGAGKAISSKDDEVEALCQDILQTLPEVEIDQELVHIKFPIQHDNCYNSLLNQEVSKFNRLHRLIVQTLNEISAAQKGQILMTE